MQNDIAAEAKAYLEKECGRAIVNLERALNRNATDAETDALQRKIDIFMYLQEKCE